MGQAQLAFGIEKPTTLDEALNVIERLSGSIASSLAVKSDTTKGPSTVRDRNWTELADGLIRARRAIKRGEGDDALYEIERCLSHLDSGWMCRA